MHYLITGHTGFKGSWMTLLLTEMGHTVSGVSLDPEPVSLFNQARAFELLRHDIRADIRDDSTMPEALRDCAPDVLIHMAAQPLVRESYRNPRVTIETNVLGTLNVLQAASAADTLRAQLIVTTDKVYRNVGRVAGYVEHEPLGGDDPYSASKAMADILTHSWATSFPGPPTAVARAGNVIGGGDYSKERLIPDVITAFSQGRSPILRYPHAVRPWQHVLDCLAGYLSITDHLLTTDNPSWDAESWNIGPGQDNFVTVAHVTTLIGNLWGADGAWVGDNEEHPEEATLLALDATRAREELGWRNLLDFTDAVKWTVQWYQGVLNGLDPQELTLTQVRDFGAAGRSDDKRPVA
jgi:CDP-glucose 4,6-dehydratase